ncbi:MAG: 4-hydroxymandelate oxidase [Candidatus Dichloromethanomonas elyunquensis]|nr:MAG: 4-hydroxymandelate oxidase [Candidatus Dichloromethanomonas elyunquensis]
MIGKLLAEGHKILEEKGTLNMKRGSETGIVQKITRDYLDVLMFETRIIDSVKAATEVKLFGQTFDTPVMTGALSSLSGICSDPMVKIARGVLAAGAVMFVGIGEEAELREITATGVKAVKIVKPYKDNERIFEKISQAEACGAFAVGMDITSSFGVKIGESVVRPGLMSPKTLEDIRGYVQSTKLPFILKGVLSVQDAEKALEAGVSAIVVSHHGGATLDYAVPTLKVLPGIVKVVGGRIPVLVDGGMTRGTDVFKALALGADGVLAGYAVMAGLAAGGAEGVENIIKGITEELRRVMSLTGSSDLSKISSDVIWR